MRKILWEKLLPESLPFDKEFNINKLASFNMTGGQIELIIKNTAYKLAAEDNPIFKVSDFIQEIKKEEKSMFDKDKKVGFMT
jgi:hypothetical protein